MCGAPKPSPRSWHPWGLWPTQEVPALVKEIPVVRIVRSPQPCSGCLCARRAGPCGVVPLKGSERQLQSGHRELCDQGPATSPLWFPCLAHDHKPQGPCPGPSGGPLHTSGRVGKHQLSLQWSPRVGEEGVPSTEIHLPMEGLKPLVGVILPIGKTGSTAEGWGFGHLRFQCFAETGRRVAGWLEVPGLSLWAGPPSQPPPFSKRPGPRGCQGWTTTACGEQ